MVGKKNFTLGSNHQDIRQRNRSLVLKLICTRQAISRIDISRLTGLSKMSITNIVNELLQDGFVVESAAPAEGAENSSSGRKPILLRPTSERYYALGIYISRDLAVATLANLQCDIVAESQCAFTFEESESSFMEKLKGLVAAILRQGLPSAAKVLGIGVACIGPLDLKNGIILEPPNFHQLKSIPIRRILEREFGFPVYVENDMNAAALAEKLYGKAKNIANFVYLGVTNGIGAGIIAGDRLFAGDMGFSGEIGHTTINYEGPKCACGNTGCLELYASIPEIVSQARNSIALGMESGLKDLAALEWPDIVNQGAAGDKLALNLLDRLSLYISIGLVSLINMFDPEIIYLGHDIALAGSLVTEKIESYLAGKTMSSKYKHVPVTISAFAAQAPAVGAAAIVLDRLFHDFI